MTDKTQPEALRLAEQISDILCQTEVEARTIAAAADSLCRQHARIAELEAQMEAVGAGGGQALSAAPAGWRELAAKVMDALADAQDTTNSQYPEHVRCYPSWERHARWLRWHADMFRSGNPVGNGAGNPDVLAALAVSPTPPAEQQAAPKAAPGEQFDADGFRAWVRQNLPDDTIIGSSTWWADHLTTWAQRFVKAAPQPAPAPLSDEREAFESTWEKLYGKKPVLWDTAFKEAKMDVPAHSAGKYFYRDAQAAWKAWQARAAIAAQGGK